MDYTNAIDALEDILMDVPDLIFAYAEDGHYLFVNKAAAEFLGADPVEVIGYHWRDLGYPESVMEPLQQTLASVFESGEPSFYRIVTTPQRGSRLLDISLTPLRAGDTGIIGVLAICRDYTEFAEKS
jgi:PAS domain S-box-containing protein